MEPDAGIFPYNGRPNQCILNGKRVKPDDGEENKFSLLQYYDTAFLVDDSRSMRDAGRWQLVQKILARSVQITIPYDPDGIDIHFFNNRRASKKGVTDAQVAKETIASVNPEG